MFSRGLALLLVGHAAMVQCAKVTTEGKQLLVDGKPFHIKGVCWNPVPFNGKHPEDRDFLGGDAPKDLDMMKAAGMNAVRVYDPISDTRVLDAMWERGLYVVMNPYIFYRLNNETGDPQEDPSPELIKTEMQKRVNAVKDHPAILFWEVGNEWNYNCLYKTDNVDGYKCGYQERNDNYLDILEKIRVACEAIKEADPNHPVASNYGEGLSTETVQYLDAVVDLWGINAYRSADFGNLFDKHLEVSQKPMYMGEYGADAWDACPGYPDTGCPEVNGPYSPVSNISAQAYATRVLTEQINAKSSITGGNVVGEFIFEWADEWWKAPGAIDKHDVGGSAPGGGPWPDQTFNEEWWGIVDIWRSPRQAYHEFAKIPNPMDLVEPTPAPVEPTPAPTPGEGDETGGFSWGNFFLGLVLGAVIAGGVAMVMRPAERSAREMGTELNA